MAIRTVFNDNDNNEMECYLNTLGNVYSSVGHAGEDSVYNGFITLDKSDVNKLVKILSELEKNME